MRPDNMPRPFAPNFCGVPIYESELAVSPIKDARRTLPPKRWHGRRCYVKRITKKLAKRFPVQYGPGIIAMRNPVGGGQMLIAHPSLMHKIIEAIEASP